METEEFWDLTSLILLLMASFHLSLILIFMVLFQLKCFFMKESHSINAGGDMMLWHSLVEVSVCCDLRDEMQF